MGTYIRIRKIGLSYILENWWS